MKQNIKSTTSDKINWHSAAFSALKIEFSQNAADLEFKSEYTLNTGPRRIDMVIVKKKSNTSLKNPIGHIFRTYNLIEYKSPKESLNINNYYKSLSYALSYKTLRFGKDYISIDDLSLTLISSRFPYKLVKELKKRKITVAEFSKGIYYINKELIRIQLIVTSRLDSQQHIWLKSLTDKTSNATEAQLLAKAYAPHQNESEYQNFMNIIIHSKIKSKEAEIMCEAMYELFAPQLQKNLEEGITIGRREGCDAMYELFAPQLQKNLEEGIAIGRKESCDAMYELFAPQLQKNLEEGIAIGRKEGMTAGKELGINVGREQGLLEGIKAIILDNLEEQKSETEILSKLIRLFSLNEEDALRYLRQFENSEGNPHNV